MCEIVKLIYRSGLTHWKILSNSSRKWSNSKSWTSTYLHSLSTLKYAKSWFARGNLLTDNLQKSRDQGKELPTEKIALQNRKEEPKNAEGMSVGVEENVYMDGSKYL